jgi:hypothetical protein
MSRKGKACNGYSFRVKLAMARLARAVHVGAKHVGKGM